MKATRFLLAAMVLGSAISVSQANAQCSGNAGSCNTTNTASVTVNALVKLGMSAAATTLTSPTADQVEVGATLADAGPSFTVKANRSWTLNVKTTNAASWTYVGSVANLWTTPYGRLLTVKGTLFAGVIACGFLNWRRRSGGAGNGPNAAPRTGEPVGTATIEILLAAAVVIVTAVFTELEHP